MSRKYSNSKSTKHVTKCGNHVIFHLQFNTKQKKNYPIPDSFNCTYAGQRRTIWGEFFFKVVLSTYLLIGLSFSWNIS